MRRAQLRDRIIAIFVEDLGVQSIRALDADLARRQMSAGRRYLTGKFIEKQPSQRLRRPWYLANSAPLTVSGRFVNAKT